jgi:hypothetical protein
MSEGKRRVVVETAQNLEHLEATTFGVVDGHLMVETDGRLTAAFAPGAWLGVFFEDAQPARVAPAA